MQIVINNSSSPGASFTDNTNKVILSCYEWVIEHRGAVKPFIEFRKEVAQAKGFNDNNARNIYPLLQKVGFVSYEKGTNLEYDRFFTNTGKAYAKTIAIELLISSSDYGSYEKNQAIKKLHAVRKDLIYQGLIRLLSKDSNYQNEMRKLLEFLLEFHKINKSEFAYLLYAISKAFTFDDIRKDLDRYRSGQEAIDVVVSVRNDMDLREQTGHKERKEGLSFLTSYSYFCGLFEQAGLITKLDSDYYTMAEGAIEKIKNLLEVK